MDPYLSRLLYVIAVIGILILLFLAIIIVLRIIISINDKRYRRRSRVWESYLLDYLQDDITMENAAKHFVKKKNYEWFRLFFTPYLESLVGRDFDKIKNLCFKINLVSHYQKKLRRGTNTGKALAAKTLGILHCQESIPEMIRLLRSSNPLLIQAAAQGLARSGSTDSFIKVTRAMLKHTYFTYEGAAEILTGYGEDICPVITDYLKEEILKMSEEETDLSGRKPKHINNNTVEPSLLISIMINMIGYFRYVEALPELDKLLQYADEETTVHILKAFLRIGKVPAPFKIKTYLDHNYWVVRSFGAQTWRLTGESGALPLLEKLLNDRHWWVRFHAASALKDVGSEGLTILKRKLDEPSGTAADISRYVLNLSEVRS